ncbi:hypothetical protein GCM10023224_10770 [Streptomonospora halophila]|uniref:Uncharacterized protein n=1 Tax=Streptomonospora halophila TaxID=427369 RepID=A0ABP9G8J6_9ACTN
MALHWEGLAVLIAALREEGSGARAQTSSVVQRVLTKGNLAPGADSSVRLRRTARPADVCGLRPTFAAFPGGFARRGGAPGARAGALRRSGAADGWCGPPGAGVMAVRRGVTVGVVAGVKG